MTPASMATSMDAVDLSAHAEGVEARDAYSIDLCAQVTGKPRETVAQWFNGQHVRGPAFAKANGIVNDVRSLTIPASGEFYQVAYKF